MPAATALVCAAVFVFLGRGASGLERVATVLFFFVVGVGAWLVVTLLVTRGHTLATALPAHASSKRLDHQYGVHIGLVSMLPWWPYAGP